MKKDVRCCEDGISACVSLKRSWKTALDAIFRGFWRGAIVEISCDSYLEGRGVVTVMRPFLKGGKWADRMVRDRKYEKVEKLSTS